MGDEGQRLRAPIDELIDGRDVIVSGPAVRGTHPLVAAVRAHGARRVMVVASSEGTGERPPDIDAVVVETAVATMSEEVVVLEQIGERLGAAHRAALDDWDPDRRAVVLANPFQVGDDLGGRAVVGARRIEWAAIEDKATVDGLLDVADVATPPHEVVTPGDARSAARRVDRGDGVVLAAGGRNGGAEAVRWIVPDEADAVAAELVSLFPDAPGDGAGRVRVAAFVEGIPCSIGAMVTADGVAVIRPVENLVLRRGRRLVYAGLSSTYDPPAAVRAEMDDAARRVGEEMRRRVGYRGAFSIDGIVGPDGWVATEVNARLSGGFNTLPAPPAGDAPHVGLLQAAVVEGRGDADCAATTIEAVYGGLADSVRSLRIARVVRHVPAGGPTHAPVVIDGGVARRATDGEEPHGSLLVGEAATGGVVLARLTSVEAPLPVGSSAAPLAASLLDLADELWGTGTGGLAPAGSAPGA